MKTLLYFTLVLLVCGCNQEASIPPLAPVQEVTETYYGKQVTDAYRYMEDLKDTTVINWFKSQAEYTRNILNSIPGRQGLINKMKEFDSRKSERVYSINITENDKYFYLKETPDDETGKLFYREGFEGEEVLLFDPETYKEDTLMYTISGISPSIDGSNVAFEIAPNGSESSELLIMKVDTKKLYPEVIDRCWFSAVSWLADGERFLYIRLNSRDVHDMERELNSKAFLHKIGQSPENDIEIFSRAKYPKLGIKEEEFPLVFYDKNNDILFAMPVTVDNRIKAFMAPADEIDNTIINWKPLFKKEDEIYYFETTENEIYAYTPKNAPNFKIIKMPLANPDLLKAEIIVPENPEAKIESFALTSDGLYYTITKGGVMQELFFVPKGETTSKKIKLPMAAGRLGIYSKSIASPDLWITIMGWTTDYQRYRYDYPRNEFISENLSSQAEYPEYENLMVEELMIPSHDGTKVPLSLIYDKNAVKKDGKSPVFIYGYGAYGISLNPFFSPSFLLSTTKGMIFAVAHVRGGGELGNEWYKAGHKATKPNTWKDLIACAEYLISENYTAKQKIAINGGSAGGILIGRAMTERPDLFAAAIPEVGCMNTMRMEFSPNGPVNIPEFGTVKDSVECMALYEMDSYHHIVSGEKYPATLITAGMNDPRVIAWQPAKFAARLQAANASEKPILFWVDYESGHGIGDTKSKYFESLSDVLCFALWQTGHPEFQRE